MEKLLQPECPEGIRARRITLEGKRDALLDHLIKVASGKGDLQADLSTIKAALAELRPEIGLLLERENRAKQQQTQPAASVPRASLAVAVPAVEVQPAGGYVPIDPSELADD